MNSNNGNGTKKEKSLLKKFIVIVVSVVGAFLIIAVAGVYGYMKSSVEDTIVGDDRDVINNVTKPEEDDKGSFLKAPKRTNFIVMGFHEEGFVADTMFVGCFNSEEVSVDILTLPRDTYVTVSKEDLGKLRAAGVPTAFVPEGGQSKINGIYNRIGSVLGQDVGREYTLRLIEEMLGVKFDYYLEVEIDGFKEIIDAMGGVEMDVPHRIYYNNPEHDPPSLMGMDIKPGLQVLNGKQSEAVIRYRTNYPRGDLARIEVQQQFIQAVGKQLMNKKTLIKNATSFISIILDHVNTNFKLGDVPRYIKYVNDIDLNEINFHVLPGEPGAAIIGGRNTESVFFHDEDETREMVKEIFYGIKKPVESDEVNIKELKIQLLNGGATKAEFKEISEKLLNDGYNVVKTGDYTGTKKYETRILTRNEINTVELEEYFENNTSVIDKEIEYAYDIVIIIGKK